MKQTHLRYALIGLLLSAAATASAEIYKWQDENGTWHFSETPPNEQAAETVDVRVTPPSGTESAASDNADGTNADEEASKSEEPLPLSPEVAAAERERKAHNCEIAKKNLANLDSRNRIRYMDKEQGVERYLTPEEHSEWKEKSQREIRENCQ